MTSYGVDLNLLRRIAKDELIRHFLEAPGSKALVIEDSLIKPLDRLVGNSVLRQNDVTKIYRFENGKHITSGDGCNFRFYLVKPTMENAKHIADHVASDRTSSLKYTVIFWPRKLHTCLSVFEQQGVYGLINVEEFNPSLIPLASDLLSLELPEFFPSTYLDGTFLWFHTVARSLWHLQTLYGPFQKIIGVGKSTESICKLTDSIFYEYREPQPQSEQPFSHLFLVDRDLDYATVFLSCLTYEALLDDVFSIQCGCVEFNAEITKTDKPTKVLLSDNDKLYSAIRCKHFSTVFEYLKSTAKQLQVNYDKRHGLENVSDLKKFVSNDLRQLKEEQRNLSLHIGASEVLIQRKSKQNFQEQLTFEHSIIAGRDYKETITFVEDLMCQQVPKSLSLSILCLLSLAQNGLPSKDYNSLRKQFLQAYGHKFLYLFFQLKKLGILYETERQQTPLNVVPLLKTSGFQMLCKKLNLIPPNEVDLKNPIDMSYVFNSAYTPAICQIVAQILQFGYNKDELQKTLGVPIFSKEASLLSSSGDSSSSSVSGKPFDKRIMKTIMVYFLGGVTYAEVAALRLLAHVRGYKIVIAATHIINKEKLLQSLLDS